MIIIVITGSCSCIQDIYWIIWLWRSCMRIWTVSVLTVYFICSRMWSFLSFSLRVCLRSVSVEIYSSDGNTLRVVWRSQCESLFGIMWPCFPVFGWTVPLVWLTSSLLLLNSLCSSGCCCSSLFCSVMDFSVGSVATGNQTCSFWSCRCGVAMETTSTTHAADQLPPHNNKMTVS